LYINWKFPLHLLSGVFQFLLRDDVIPIEYASRLVTGDFHRERSSSINLHVSSTRLMLLRLARRLPATLHYDGNNQRSRR